MFLDACAIVSLMTNEQTASTYTAQLAGAKSFTTSPLAAFEAILVLSRPDKLNQPFSITEKAVLLWLDARNIGLRDPSSPRRTLSYAVAIAEKHGVGKRALSTLDCFHYAYARAMRERLTLDKILLTSDAIF
jgi:ribonuclease VapC